jgi:hypothetical protein
MVPCESPVVANVGVLSVGSPEVPVPDWPPNAGVVVVVDEPCEPGDEPDVVVVVVVVTVVVVVVGGDDFGTKVPSRCHRPVKLLNGPPTMALDQVRVKVPEPELYVPVDAEVSPGMEPPGFGEP